MEKLRTTVQVPEKQKEIWNSPKLTVLKSLDTQNNPVAGGDDANFDTSPQ